MPNDLVNLALFNKAKPAVFGMFIALKLLMMHSFDPIQGVFGDVLS